MQNLRRKGEKGQILILVLILMLVGSLVIPPLLGYMMTGLRAGRMYENRMLDDYAADAGVEDAFWHIMIDDYRLPRGSGNFWSYTLDEKMNNRDVDVSIDYIWLLEGIEKEPEGAAPDSDWVVTTQFPNMGEVRVEITYAGRAQKNFERIGVLIPSNFDYIEGSCLLYEDNITSNEPTIFEKGRRTVIIWDGLGMWFQEHETRTQTFKVTPTDSPPWGFSWIRFRFQSPDAYLSWDDSNRIYRITSTAGVAKVTSYTFKGPSTGFGRFQTVVLSYTK